MLYSDYLGVMKGLPEWLCRGWVIQRTMQVKYGISKGCTGV